MTDHTHDWDSFLPASEQSRGCTALTMLVAQVMNFAAVKGHTELALKAWECMEYAILPAAPFPSGKSRLGLSGDWLRLKSQLLLDCTIRPCSGFLPQQICCWSRHHP